MNELPDRAQPADGEHSRLELGSLGSTIHSAVEQKGRRVADDILDVSRGSRISLLGNNSRRSDLQAPGRSRLRQ